MNKDTAATPDENQLDFESAINELEQLVEKLEHGDLSLNDSLAHFERGVTLSRHCHDVLEQARHTVTVLSNPDDPESEQDFADTDEHPGEAPGDRTGA